MGIFDFIQKGAQEMFIARPDNAKGLMVWKWPDPTIPMKAQLTVMDDECAFFFRDGHMVGKIDGGRRVTLESSNIPFLDQLVDKFTGGNVLKAEVWFVTMREMAGMRFGGRIGSMKDPESGIPAELKVHGDFSIQVADPAKAIAFFGTRQNVADDEFEGFFREQVLKVIRDRIAELLVKKRWPLLDVTSGAYTEEIEQEVIVSSKVHLDSYGVKCVRLGNFEIGIDEKGEAKLREIYEDNARLRMAGGVQGYQMMAAGKAMMGAGEAMAHGGPGGGPADGNNPMLQGAGLGVGFGMAQMFQQPQHPQYPQGYPPPGYPPPGYPPPQGYPPPGYPQQGAPQQQQAPSLVACPGCHKQVAPGKFCAECGTALAPAKTTCPSCQQELPPGAKFCSGCGNKIG